MFSEFLERFLSTGDDHLHLPRCHIHDVLVTLFIALDLDLLTILTRHALLFSEGMGWHGAE